MAQDRSIRVRFKAEFGDLSKQLDDAAKKSDVLGQKIEASSKKVETARSRQRAAAEQAAAAEKRLQEVQQRSNATTEQKKKASQEVSNARRAEKAATENLTRAEQEHAKVANQATTSSGKLAQSAMENSDQWQRAGTVLLSAGAAITAVGVAAIKAGISYNSLQQKSRAAMSTLLGGAEAANEQMDKLDAFAKTSPFSKQTFITAQQQMIAFGVETSKVIPYLDALNDTTAAAGGNAQTLGELAFIMAQISAAGKITGQDLIQFGQRGVNAAEMIGLSMGKTGAEIRAEITAGTLDANAALDAMAAGMKQANDGAAANVKLTWEGALDRVSAAWRDLGSELAEPLVGKEGGGILVDMANAAADATRNFMALPDPIKNSALAVTALTGGVLLLAGGYLTLWPRILKTSAALKKQHADMLATSKTYPMVAKGAKLAGKALGGLALAAAAIAAGPSEGIKQTNEMIDLLEQVGQKGEDVNALLAGVESGMPNWLDSGVGEFRDVLKDVSSPGLWGQLGNGLASFAEGIGGFFGLDWRSSFGRQMDQLKAYGPQLASLADSDLPAATSAFNAMYEAAGGNYQAYEDLMKAMPEYRDAVIGIARANNMATDDVTLLRIATGKLEAQSADAAKAAEEQASAEAKAAQERARSVGYIGKLSEEAVDYLKKWREAAADANASFISGSDAYSDALQELEDKERARAEAAAEASGDTTKSWEDFYGTVEVSAKDYIKQLEDQVAAQQNWEDNMVTLAQRVNEGMTGEMRAAGNAMIDELMSLGPEGAGQVARLESMSDKQFSKVVNLWKQKGTTAVTEFTSRVESYRQPLLDIGVNLDEAYRDVSAFIRDQSGRRIHLTVDNRGNSTINTGKGNAIGRATGGAVHGPGTATSDSIPAMLSNGEHVLTASDVQKLGGQHSVYRMRAMAQSGMLRFATGGAVASAKAERDAAKKAAKAELDSAKAAKKRADNRLKRAEDALKLERERRDQRQDYGSEFRTAHRRGEGALSQVRDGSGLSVVDDMLGWVDSGAFSKSRNQKLRATAKSAEKKLISAYDRLEDANNTFDTLASLYDDVRAGFSSGWGLSGLLGQKDWTGSPLVGSGSDIASNARGYANKLKTLGGKLSQLRKDGASPALIEQIARLDVDEAIQVADAFLADPGSASATSAALSEIDTNANAIGFSVAQAAAGDGAADLYIARGGDLGSAAVNAIKDEVDSIGKSLARAFEAALDGKTPAKNSKKTAKKKSGKKAGKRAAGGMTVMGQPYLVGEEGPELFVPGVTGTIIPSRLTIPAVQAASGVTNTMQPIDYTQLARAVAQEVVRLPIQVDIHAGTKYQTESTRRGLSELDRSGDQTLQKVRSR